MLRMSTSQTAGTKAQALTVTHCDRPCPSPVPDPDFKVLPMTRQPRRTETAKPLNLFERVHKQTEKPQPPDAINVPLEQACGDSGSALACTLCNHWDPISEEPECHSGFCRRLALGPTDDTWSITEAEDSCEHWTSKNVPREEGGLTLVERRTVTRIPVDCPAQLRMPAGDRAARLIDISEKGARLRLSNPPTVGASTFLQWSSNEVFCYVKWANEDSCGVSFDKPIPRELVVKTTGESDKTTAFVANPRNIPPGRKRTK